jgi:hypothetical protein
MIHLLLALALVAGTPEPDPSIIQVRAANGMPISMFMICTPTTNRGDETRCEISQAQLFGTTSSDPSGKTCKVGTRTRVPLVFKKVAGGQWATSTQHQTILTGCSYTWTAFLSWGASTGWSFRETRQYTWDRKVCSDTGFDKVTVGFCADVEKRCARDAKELADIRYDDRKAVVKLKCDTLEMDGLTNDY